MPGRHNEILPSKTLSVNGLIFVPLDYSNLKLPEKYEVPQKINASFFSGTVIKILMKCTYIVGTYCTPLT